MNEHYSPKEVNVSENYFSGCPMTIIIVCSVVLNVDYIPFINFSFTFGGTLCGILKMTTIY